MGSGHRGTNNQHAEEPCYFGRAAGSQRWRAGHIELSLNFCLFRYGGLSYVGNR